MGRVVLTFKNNEKEKAIESFLDNKVSASAFIKELVWAAMNNGTMTESIKLKNQKQESEQKTKPKVGGFR